MTSKYFYLIFFYTDSLSDMINCCLSGLNARTFYFHTRFNQTPPQGKMKTRNVLSSTYFNSGLVFSAVIQYLVVAFEAADHAGDLVDQAEVVD